LLLVGEGQDLLSWSCSQGKAKELFTHSLRLDTGRGHLVEVILHWSMDPLASQYIM